MGYYRTHNCSELNASHTGQNVVLSGWLANQRDWGGILFIALRDHYGVTQLTIPSAKLTILSAQLTNPGTRPQNMSKIYKTLSFLYVFL